jgi:hypothetical protein
VVRAGQAERRQPQGRAAHRPLASAGVTQLAQRPLQDHAGSPTRRSRSAGFVHVGQAQKGRF